MLNKIIDFFRTNPKIGGIVIVVVALLLLGYLSSHFVSPFNVDFPKETLPLSIEEEPAATDADGETPAGDAESISVSEEIERMGVQFEMSKEIEKRIPDLKSFKEEFAAYLAKEGFSTDVSRAACENIITEDFNAGTLQLSFTLNNDAFTLVDVLCDKKRGTYTFNYY